MGLTPSETLRPHDQGYYAAMVSELRVYRGMLDRRMAGELSVDRSMLLRKMRDDADSAIATLDRWAKGQDR